MSNYAIMRIEKRKLGAVTGICNHHERLKDVYKSNPDIDPERTHLNYHIRLPSDKYRSLVLKRIEEARAKKRSNSIVLQDCIATATPDWINESKREAGSVCKNCIWRITDYSWYARIDSG